MGRLLARVDATATTMPDIQDVACGEALVPSFKSCESAGSTPVRFNPSTRMNRPATNGSTDQEMSLTTGSGDFLVIRRMTAVTVAPAVKVGNPRSRLMAEA